MIGYKAFKEDLTCKNFHYEIGNTYEIEGELEICKNGFHFCEDIKNVYRYYPMDNSTRVCKIEALGEIQSNGNKYCTNKIKILEEVTDKNVRNCNNGIENTGYLNIGNNNSGNRNVGDNNSNNDNVGYSNQGNKNIGDNNIGNKNIGGRNQGDSNIGSSNSGICNIGYYNLGKCNIGDCNCGDNNIGEYNSGNSNVGNYNWGENNVGEFNIGNCNIGFFNTEVQTIRLFNHQTNIAINSTTAQKIKDIMQTFWYNLINSYYSSEKIKEWWDEYVTTYFAKEKEFIESLPYYDEGIFLECLSRCYYKLNFGS